MDQRDQELLDRQLRRITPVPRNDGILAVTGLVVFLAGVALGGVLVKQDAETSRIALNAQAPALLEGTPLIPR